MTTATAGLATTIRAAGVGDLPLDVATVTSATLVGGRVPVLYDGEPQTLPKLRRYTPVNGDTVVLGRIGAQLFIIDAFG